MFLRAQKRKKDGKTHTYWSIVENRRLPSGKVLQKSVLYLGEINSSQQAAWRKSIDIISERDSQMRQASLFDEDNAPETVDDSQIIRLRLSDLTLHNPREWGGCWLADHLYRQLQLDDFWALKLPPSRKGTRWDLILQTLVTYRLLSPGSEWRLHRQWFDSSAMTDILDQDFSLAEIHKLYKVHDMILEHRQDLFKHLTQRWKDLFNTSFEVILYDLTSTYFESVSSGNPDDIRLFGYSRDKRSDCVQVVVALVITPEGFPLAYEVLPGNTRDCTTLKSFLEKIETLYGKAQRVWLMDRGIPTEDMLREMRECDPPVHYLVGTPRGSLGKHEKEISECSWQKAREDVDVKLFSKDQEVYVLARSGKRVFKERAMRKRKLRKLVDRLKKLRGDKKLTRDQLLIKLGQAKEEAGSIYKVMDIRVPLAEEEVNETNFVFSINRRKLQQIHRREGRYLLRSNLTSEDPSELWEKYMTLVQVEEAFRNLKGDLSIRPVYHQLEERIHAHIFISFMAYCLHVTLKGRLRQEAGGLTPRSVLEKMKGIQMIDVHLPTTEGSTIIMSRYTQPDKEQQLLLEKLRMRLPDQPPPRIKSNGEVKL